MVMIGVPKNKMTPTSSNQQKSMQKPSKGATDANRDRRVKSLYKKAMQGKC